MGESYPNCPKYPKLFLAKKMLNLIIIGVYGVKSIFFMQKQVDLPWRFLAYTEDGVRLAGFDCSGPQRPSVPSNSGAAPGSYNPEECM